MQIKNYIEKIIFLRNQYFKNKKRKISVKRYCIQQLGTGKGFEDINFVWSFADQNEEGNHFNIT